MNINEFENNSDINIKIDDMSFKIIGILFLL